MGVTAETPKKLVARGRTVRMQSGTGVPAAVVDEAYRAVGAEITDAAAKRVAAPAGLLRRGPAPRCEARRLPNNSGRPSHEATSTIAAAVGTVGRNG